MNTSSANTAPREMVREFLGATLPFSELASKDIEMLAGHCVIDFVPQQTMLLVQGETRVEHLLLIQTGGVRLYIEGEQGKETLIDYRGEGQTVGGLALFEGGVASLNAQTVEDTFLFRMDKDVFLRLVDDNPVLSSHFLKNFSRNYAAKAFSELRQRGSVTCESGLYLFSTRLGGLVHRAPVTVPLGTTIREGAMVMLREGVGSLLIHDPSHAYLGIVTDTDLRKTVALGMDYEASIETIMATPLVTVDSDKGCFDGLLTMMARKIHHLAVEQDGQIIGVVTSHDILVMQGKSPMSVFSEISATRTIEGLYPLAARVPVVVRTLVAEGAKAGNICKLITILNDTILERLLTLLQEEMGPPPVPFCWMLMGSEGRRDQTFATDQDNALVYRTGNDEILERAAAVYFEPFTRKAIDHLIKCGFPACPGEVMASNPRWRRSFEGWRNRFEGWIGVPEPEEIRNASIFFDFRSGYGMDTLTRELRKDVADHARRSDIFLRCLASDCLESRPPLSFFRNFIVEKNGEHRNRLDIKKQGQLPFTDFARVLALKHGIRDTNTLDRLDRAYEGGHLPRDLYQDAREAYEFLLHLRLVHQLELVEQGEVPHNHIDPARLSELEKQTMKEAFAVVGRIQTFLREMFRLNV